MIKEIQLNDVVGTAKRVPLNNNMYNKSFNNIKWGRLSEKEYLLVYRLMDHFYKNKKMDIFDSALHTQREFPLFNSGKYYTVRVEKIIELYKDYLSYEYHLEHDKIEVYDMGVDENTVDNIVRIKQYF